MVKHPIQTSQNVVTAEHHLLVLQTGVDDSIDKLMLVAHTVRGNDGVGLDLTVAPKAASDGNRRGVEPATQEDPDLHIAPQTQPDAIEKQRTKLFRRIIGRAHSFRRGKAPVDALMYLRCVEGDG